LQALNISGFADDYIQNHNALNASLPRQWGVSWVDLSNQRSRGLGGWNIVTRLWGGILRHSHTYKANQQKRQGPKMCAHNRPPGGQ
jgi:hypothetical protein